MLITEALLPPKNGYVESRDKDDNPIYIPTNETLKKELKQLELEGIIKENTVLKAQMQFQTERADLLEGALIEIASMVVE